MAKFKLYALNNGQQEHWIFDTARCKVYDNSGKELLTQFPAMDTPHTIPFTRDHNPNKKGQENNLLEISLGFNCNFKCEYCSQNLLKNKAYSSKPSDVAPFLAKLDASGLRPTKIQLWGGEPFVYWKTMEVLIPGLRQRFPEASISVTTNGSLITKEKIDFLMQYGIDIFLSHDGPVNDFRYKDVLKDPTIVEAFRHLIEKYGLEHFQIGTTLGKGNTDVIKVAHFFEQIFHTGYKLSIGVHNVVRCHDSKDINQVLACTLSDLDLQTYTNSIFTALNSPHVNYYGCSSLEFRLQYAIECLIIKEPIESVTAECRMPFSDGLLTDMQGNILTCHNHATQEYTCGKLDDLSSVHAIGYNFWANKKRCVNCPVIHFCKGGCPSADDKANELACPNLKALYMGILKALFARMFGIYVQRVELLDEV